MKLPSCTGSARVLGIAFALLVVVSCDDDESRHEGRLDGGRICATGAGGTAAGCANAGPDASGAGGASGTGGSTPTDGGPDADSGVPDAPEGGSDGGNGCGVAASGPCAEPHLAAPPTFADCIFTSPLLVTSRGEEWILVVPRYGPVTAVSKESGQVGFQVVLPSPDDRKPSTIATPVVVGRRVFVAYHVEESSGRREQQRVAVVDLETRALDPDFEVLELAATKPTWDGTGQVDFLSDHALARSALTFGTTTGAPEGFVYVTYGNAQDIQPWHGWVFELDVGKWRSEDGTEAVSSVLLTSPEDYCPVEGQSGSRDMVCGGGIWAPSGPLVLPNPEGTTFELVIPTGNGLLDVSRQHYSNSILRTGPGLAFDPDCDQTACAPFDPVAPAEACMASCTNLFMPRLQAGDPPLAPTSGACDGMTFVECYAALDYDLGANTPAVTTFGGKRLFVLPGKDGAVYLFDADHMGTLYDREVIVEQCGTPTDPCAADWAGMMVTEPLITQVAGETRVLVPTFMMDRTHPAGMVSLALVEGSSGPELQPRWQAPRFDTEEAKTRFRRHVSRAALIDLGNEQYVAWVNVVFSGTGTLYVARVTDGEIVLRVPLAGKGRRFIEPLVHEGVLWTTSCSDNAGPGILEAIRFTP